MVRSINHVTLKYNKHFLKIPNFNLYHVLSIKFLWISTILLISTGLKLTEKKKLQLFLILFFSYWFENLLKYSLNTVHDFLFQRSLLWNDIFLEHWKIRNCCFHVSVDLIQILFPDCVKLIGYFASALSSVSFNLCPGPSQWVEILFPLLFMHRRIFCFITL